MTIYKWKNSVIGASLLASSGNDSLTSIVAVLRQQKRRLLHHSPNGTAIFMRDRGSFAWVRLVILISLVCGPAIALTLAAVDAGVRKAPAEDPLRPLYHLTSPGGRIHDPQGIAFWKEKY